ncbi:hypothetical protein LQT97_00455 [Brucella pseudogrignonensis]|uniref:hypothetical protein n=1 Tax=Brucella pseudogrignonensis TaxID=419475 RepID=UPI001E3165A8|nr:hypothetical protein [Brucella pseudogrignonensis]MCD4509694.1 hypothetical protein [Brucella pseudogrignonensis]
MNGPKGDGNYPDRGVDCQEHVMAKLIAALDEATLAGWTRLEAAEAIMRVAIALDSEERGRSPED